MVNLKAHKQMSDASEQPDASQQLTLAEPHAQIDPAAALYHELRAPLALIATLAASLGDEVDGVALERSRSIHRTAQRMLRTAEAVVAAAGERQATPDEGCFLPSIVTRRFFDGVDAFGFEVRLECTQAAERAIVQGSAVVFEALLQVLISNAFDHGDNRSALAVAMQTRGKVFRIRLANRIGTRRHKGPGIGHHLCQRMVEQLGGSIELERSRNYFTVLIELPLAPTGLRSPGERERSHRQGRTRGSPKA